MQDRRCRHYHLENAFGGSWQVAANLDPETVPGSDDDIVIPVFVGITVTCATVMTDLNSLDCIESLEVVSGTFKLATTSNIDGTLTVSGGTLGGGGNLTVGAPTFSPDRCRTRANSRFQATPNGPEAAWTSVSSMPV